MKKSLGVFFALILFAVGSADASALVPQAGKHYKVLKTPQAVSVAAGKIEVIEFFWYGCPHCKDFDPLIEAWASKQDPDIVFKRVPIAFDANLALYQTAYHDIQTQQQVPNVTIATIAPGNPGAGGACTQAALNAGQCVGNFGDLAGGATKPMISHRPG